jgi:hypothetical protein
MRKKKEKEEERNWKYLKISPTLESWRMKYPMTKINVYISNVSIAIGLYI